MLQILILHLSWDRFGTGKNRHVGLTEGTADSIPGTDLRS